MFVFAEMTSLWWFFDYYVCLEPRPHNKAGLVLILILLDVNSNNLSDVRVLYRDVNWHGVLPFLFVFCLLFHCDPQFCAAGSRVFGIHGTP
jgi:hypothetical protein